MNYKALGIRPNLSLKRFSFLFHSSSCWWLQISIVPAANLQSPSTILSRPNPGCVQVCNTSCQTETFAQLVNWSIGVLVYCVLCIVYCVRLGRWARSPDPRLFDCLIMSTKHTLSRRIPKQKRNKTNFRVEISRPKSFITHSSKPRRMTVTGIVFHQISNLGIAKLTNSTSPNL